MRCIETIREFKRKNFSVVVKAMEDHDLDLSFDETGETARKIDSGELMGFGVVVEVFANGLDVGSDSLWNCVYTNPRAFMDHFGARVYNRKLQAKENRKAKREGREPHKICCGSYFSDMVREAIADARKNLDRVKSLPLREVQS